MKRILSTIILALMVIALPVGLIGCKKGSTSTTEGNVIGTWVFSEVYTLDDVDPKSYPKTSDWEGIYFSFKKDKTAETNYYGDDFLSGTWKIVGNKLLATFKFEEKGQLEKESLSFNIENNELEYVKIDKAGNTFYYVFIPESK